MKLIVINMKVLFCLFVLSVYSVSVWAEPIKKHDYSNDISVETLKYRMSKDEEFIIVDVRNKSEFEKMRIAGSVNIPLFVLKTQTHYKRKQLVIGNNGFSRSLLEKECESLNKSGFNIKILSGGLSAWQRKGNSLEGDQLEVKKLNRIKPVEFFLEKEFQSTFLMEISEKVSRVFRNIEKFKHIPVTGKTFKLGKYIKSLKSKIPLSIVIANKNGENYDRIRKQFPKSENFNIFFLEGGSDQYLSFLEKNTRMHTTRKQRLVKQEGCMTCGDNED